MVILFCSGIWWAAPKKKIIKVEGDENSGLWRFTKLNLAFQRFSTCEDFIKEYKYDNIPNKESSFKNNSTYLDLRNEIVKIGTGP